MEQAVHWIIEVMWSYSDHMASVTSAAAGGYAATATKHIWIGWRARVKARKEARLIADSLTKE